MLADFPALEDIVAGDRVRSFELLTALAAPRRRVVVRTLGSPPSASWRAPHLDASALPIRPGRMSDAGAMAVIGRALRRHAADARTLGARPVLYVKIPSGLYLRGGLAPVHSNPTHLLVPLARRLGYLVWSTVHDLPPDHDVAVQERLWRSGAAAAARAPRAVRSTTWMAGREAEWTLRRSDLVTVVSEGMRRAVIERSGLPPERVVVATTGVNPDLVRPIPPWSPPGPGEVVTLAYLGSPYDVETGRLLEAVEHAGARAGRRLLLRLATGVPAGFQTGRVAVDVRPSAYSGFAEYAATVDIWLNCFHPADRYIMEMGSPIKLPMYLASGRPTVTTSGPYLERDGLAPWAVAAEPTGRGLEDAILGLLADLPAARARAEVARHHILEHRRWTATAATVADRIDAMASGPAPPRAVPPRAP